MGIGEKNPNFMKPDPSPTPVDPDDPPSHDSGFLIAIISAVVAIILVLIL
jgi:hypothetical protein